MKMLGKILLPTDFTGSSQGAIDMAIELANKFETEIILLHVLPEFTKSRSVLDLMTKNVHFQLSSIQEYLHKGGVDTADPIISIGNNWHHIVQTAKKLDVNLILMGSGEKGRGEKFKLGTTSENVIRHTNVPVWIVKNDTPASIRSVICPIDFSGPSKRALINAIQIARTFEATLKVITVIAPLAESFLGLGSLMDSEHKLIEEKQKLDFNEFLNDFDFKGIEHSIEILQGKPSQEILKSITTASNSLLIMGTTGKSGISKILMGSVTEKVIREVPCSFITLKTKNAIRLNIKSDLRTLSHHYKEGKALLKEGFSEEALKQFQACLTINNLYAPAWDGIAKAHKNLGNNKQAKKSSKQGDQIRERINNQKVEADIRSKHHLFGKN